MTLKDQELYANKIKLYNQKFETIREKPYFVCSPYFDMNNERSRQTLMQFSTKREQTSHRHQHFNSPTENLEQDTFMLETEYDQRQESVTCTWREHIVIQTNRRWRRWHSKGIYF